MDSFLTLLQKLHDIKVIDGAINYSSYVALDLSDTHINTLALDVTNAILFEEFVRQHLQKNKAKVAFGGYLETRNLYKRSTVFKNNLTSERNIHIGLDLWTKANTPVLAALDGTIHSFQNNTALGDYGPTIILEHKINNHVFYTLYGHLSLESLHGKKIGQAVYKLEQIATLGAPPINGDYAPHLHFQIIKDLEGKTGDYPGVCSINDVDFYKKNCPDPNILLKIF